MDILAQNQITPRTSLFAAISEQDLADMGFAVGQKILFRRVISHLEQDSEDPQPSKPVPSEASGLLPAIDLQQGLSNIKGAFSISSPSKDNDVAKPPAAFPSVTTDPNSSPEAKPLLPPHLMYGANGKQLKPLQLSHAQFMLANIKILGSLFTKNPREAEEYLSYLKIFGDKTNSIPDQGHLSL